MKDIMSKKNNELNNPVLQKRFFTWDIHYACNYRCKHCYFNGQWEELAKQNRYPGIERWLEIWKEFYDKYGTCYIHISGGEPFAYPGIIDLVAGLVKWHYVGFDTNLSFDEKEFMSKVNTLDRVSFSASFHPEFVKIEDFLKKYHALRDAGCKAKGMNFVAYPPVLVNLQEYREKAWEYDFDITVLPYRGQYKGKEYPKSYTEQEREKIWGDPPERTVKAKYLDKEKYKEKEHNDSDPINHTPDPSIAMLDWYSDQNSREGLKCYMGVVYSKIHPDGTAHRCCMTWENWGCLGNIIDGTFKFYDEPKPCPYAKCACSTAMIAGEEGRWQGHWENRIK